MPAKIDDFRHLIPDDVLQRFGPLIKSWPKWTWERSPWAQVGFGVVGAAVAVTLLVVSFQVVVSNKPEEQLPFQQAMWGFAGAFGILMLYGFGTAAWRAMFGVASVGPWWLLFERGLVILKNGKLQTASPLDELRIKSATDLAGKPQLLDADSRPLSLPMNAEEEVVKGVQELQREERRNAGQAPHTRIPYALIWAEAKWIGEDRVFRVYPNGKSVLLIYAGTFLPEKMGLNKGFLPGATGLVAGLATAYGDWMAGKDFDKRAAWLDAMSLEELRVEAHNNDASRILTASTTTEINLGPPVSRFWSNDYLQSKVTGRLIFKHKGKKWELAFFTPEERDFALRALREAFGPEQITCELAIETR